MRRAVRIARLLAIGGFLAGCASPSSALTDASPASDGGTCVSFRDADLACGAGRTCLVDEDANDVVCRSVDSGFLHACGEITCGWECVCGNADASICGCVWGMTGPLPPPDFLLIG